LSGDVKMHARLDDAERQLCLRTGLTRHARDWIVHEQDLLDFFQPEWTEASTVLEFDPSHYMELMNLEGEDDTNIRCVRRPRDPSAVA